MKKLFVLVAMTLLCSCGGDEPNVKPDNPDTPSAELKAKSVKVEDLGNGIKKFNIVDLPTSKQIGQKLYYSKFNLEKGAYVTGNDWDIAFYNRSIIVNGGSTTIGQDTYSIQILERTGNAAIAIMGTGSAGDELKKENLVITAKETDGDYLNVKEVPADIQWQQASRDKYAIDDFSKGMFEYNLSPIEHIVTIKKNRFLIIRTHNGHYAKLKILSYYQGAGATAQASLATGSMEAGMKYANYFTFTYNYNTQKGNKKLQ